MQTSSASVLLSIFGGATGHGSILIPLPRNSIDATLPAWSHGKHPPSGSHVWSGNACNCANGTDYCNSGQSCFWFSQGCTIGCNTCDGDGARLPNWDHCPRDSINATLNDPKYRTANRNATAGSADDIWKYQPWRAPGRAPVEDPCGMAGGIKHQSPKGGNGGNGGTYNTTRYAKQGDLGSKVLQPRPSGTVWKRGAAELTAWYITFNHGGGYRYRLCPADQELTEACFAATPLDFVGTMHTVRYHDNSTIVIPNNIVKEGGGVGWMMNPIPNQNSDVGSGCDHPDGTYCGGCPCGSGYPGGASSKDFPNPLPGNGTDAADNEYRIEDYVRVPTAIAAGEYVLGWRWDCETSSQVWQACADITIQ